MGAFEAARALRDWGVAGWGAVGEYAMGFLPIDTWLGCWLAAVRRIEVVKTILVTLPDHITLLSKLARGVDRCSHASGGRERSK